jgi:vacuolar-type H+-ATPase subunit I/STV1
MGKLIWHEYSRFVSITATIYAIWASFWGFFYRKFFWDFVGGTLRDPGGMQAPPSAAVFVTLIVKIPLIQVAAMLLGFTLLALEWPLPLLKSTSIYRSFVARIVLLLFQTFLGVLFYQGTNAALWSLIAIFCYTRALTLGEDMAEAKENRGQVGQA